MLTQADVNLIIYTFFDTLFQASLIALGIIIGIIVIAVTITNIVKKLKTRRKSSE